MEMNRSDTENGSLGQILGRVGFELANAAQAVDDLHTVVAFASEEGSRSPVFIRKVQTIDLLQQHLQALSSFMLGLSESVPATWSVAGSAADHVKLSRLRENLIRVQGSNDEGDHKAGDLSVF
jgi:hypothetical protein